MQPQTQQVILFSDTYTQRPQKNVPGRSGIIDIKDNPHIIALAHDIPHVDAIYAHSYRKDIQKVLAALLGINTLHHEQLLEDISTDRKSTIEEDFQRFGFGMVLSVQKSLNWGENTILIIAPPILVERISPSQFPQLEGKIHYIKNCIRSIDTLSLFSIFETEGTEGRFPFNPGRKESRG